MSFARSKTPWWMHIGSVVAILAIVGLGPRRGEAQSFRYGVRGGLSLSTAASEFPDADIDWDLKRRRGLSVLGFGEWRANSVLSLVAETGYVQRGYRDQSEMRNEQGERIGTITHTTSFGYASAAILGKARHSGSYAPYVVAGPHLSVLMHSSFDSSVFDKSENLVTRHYDSLTVGGTVGVGIETDRLLPSLSTALEVRYGMDVTDSLSDVPRTLRNQTLDVLISVGF